MFEQLPNELVGLCLSYLSHFDLFDICCDFQPNVERSCLSRRVYYEGNIIKVFQNPIYHGFALSYNKLLERTRQEWYASRFESWTCWESRKIPYPEMHAVNNKRLCLRD